MIRLLFSISKWRFSVSHHSLISINTALTNREGMPRSGTESLHGCGVWFPV